MMIVVLCRNKNNEDNFNVTSTNGDDDISNIFSNIKQNNNNETGKHKSHIHLFDIFTHIYNADLIYLYIIFFSQIKKNL